MRKILITEINMPPADIKSGAMQNLAKDRIILNWLIKWVENGLREGLFSAGDLIPAKKDFAKFHNVSTGTIQNAIRYAEDLGYFKSRQCKGTMIVDKNAQNEMFLGEKGTSKKDAAALSIKKYIVEKKLKKGTILPSARILAIEADASQNTVRLALEILILEKIIEEKNKNSNKPVKILTVDYKDIEIPNGEEKTETLPKKLCAKMKKYITENYKLNDKIMPNEDFARLFKVSVRTVNDAMKQLNKEKIVISLRGRYGTRYINEPDKLLKKAESGEKSKFMSSPKSSVMNIKNSYSYSWERVLDQIKKYMITNHEAGDKLPSMKNLAETLNVSSNTVRRAVGELVKNGILFCQRGKHGGIYIIEMPAKEDVYTWLALNPKFLIQ